MAFRLTVVLALVIYLTMRFAGGPIPEPTAAELARSEAVGAETGQSGTEPQATADTPDATPPAEATGTAAVDTTVTAEGSRRIILAPPGALSPALEDGSAQAAFDPLDPPAGTLISPEEALPEGFAGGGLGGGLGGALDLRDQVSAALDEAQENPARPSLSDLARPGGGQPARAQPDPAGSTPPAPAATPGGPLAEVIASSVNLRGGPSTLNQVVGRVGEGALLEIRGEFSGGWVAVGHPDTGETVYISGQFLDPLGN